jgi:RimJ/RimL family protein N-acetyltransferase
MGKNVSGVGDEAMPRLLGERIMLREYREGDFASMRTWCNDSEVVDYLSDVFLYPHTESMTEQYLNTVMEADSEQKGFVIAHKDTEAYIGQVDLFRINWKNRSTEMGIVIGNKHDFSKGYGSEAIRLLQQFVFTRLNLNRLQLEVYDYNERAYRCYVKCGFKEEGRLREAYYFKGRYADTIVMSILKSDYERERGKAE